MQYSVRERMETAISARLSVLKPEDLRKVFIIVSDMESKSSETLYKEHKSYTDDAIIYDESGDEQLVGWDNVKVWIPKGA